MESESTEMSIILIIIKYLILLYTYITYPIYYAIQKPWISLRRIHRERARLEDPNDRYSPWVRTRAEEPEYHYINDCRTVPELLKMSIEVNGSDERCFGYRQILNEEVVESDGTAIKKWDLSDYQWLTYGEVDQRITNISRGLLMNDIKPKDTVLIFCETRLGLYLNNKIILICFNARHTHKVFI